MRNLLNPKWIFLVNILPVTVLFFLYLAEFNIIKSLLSEENILLWKIFGGVLGGLTILNFAYAVWTTIRKVQVSYIYAILALISYIPYIYLYANYMEDIIPFNVPRWMIPGDFILYVGTFLMPTLAYSLFVLVVHFTSESKKHKAWKNFLAALLVPILWYVFIQVIFPLWKPVKNDFFLHTLIIFIIIGTMAFLFFLIRGILILTIKKSDFLHKYQLLWKIPVAIVFPLTGLAINNGHLISEYAIGSGVFGDFSNSWFYILAFLNGLLLCLPDIQNKIYRVILFIGRSITFTFSFYFFVIFLPFLPLSVLAIVAAGAGFLMLSPLILMVIHISQLSKDYRFLKNFYSQKLIWPSSLASLFVIPLYIIASFLIDKNVLNETLNYLYHPDYSKTYNIDKNSLRSTLGVIKYHKDRGRELIFGKQIPYLSSYFNWIVLDNMTLSDSKINQIEKVFLGETSFNLWSSDDIRNENVTISDIKSHSRYDSTQNVWVSWIDLEITNHNSNSWGAEYATTIKLPEGCWISNYYLFVGDKKEMGILAEKKSAMWVFSQIRNTNRDPGILYYLTGNKVAFRVFPFGNNEVRKTGIEFIHKEPTRLNIDNHTVQLGDTSLSIADKTFKNKSVIYVSPKEKQKLKKVNREPYYHFIVDISKGKEKFRDNFIEKIEQFLLDNKALAEDAQISFTNFNATTIPTHERWKEIYSKQQFEGGFFLERTVKTVLINSYKKKNNSYPVIVAVTDSIENSILEKDFSDLEFTFPDCNIFFSLDEIGALQTHSLVDDPLKPVEEYDMGSFYKTVLKYSPDKNSVEYLPDNNEPSIILINDLLKVSEDDIHEKNWKSALIMQAKWRSQILHPETSNQEWYNHVKYSFISKIMTPVTSYLVVENEAQKAMLKKKQEDVLSSKQSLDLNEDAQRMSEPELIVLILLMLLLVLVHKFRKNQWSVFKR